MSDNISKRITYRVHAIRRMYQRGITEEHVEHTLLNGETIEDYPDDKTYPSRLIYGETRGRVIHVVAADNPQENELIVITTYVPDLKFWTNGLKRRREN